VKLIVANIREHALEKVEKGLAANDIRKWTIHKVHAYGEELRSFNEDFVSRVKIEIFADDNEADKIIELIQRSAWTGLKGDGIIALLPVEYTMKIRTKEKNKK
jgi:nitrogen regulatory protein PII